MDDNEHEGTFDHLFTDAVQGSAEPSPYDPWRSATAANPDAVSLGVGYPFPDLFPDDELGSAAESSFDADPEALQYGGGEDADRLVEIVGDRVRKRGIDCTPDQIVLTDGATRAIDAVSQAFLDPGRIVFTEAPTFTGSLKVFRNYGATIVGCSLDRDGLDIDAIERELRDRQRDGRGLPTLCYMIPTFQNPTGTTLSLERRRKLLELAAEYDFVILEDDAYGELRYDGENVAPLAALDESGRVVYVGTFSKTIAPGVRVGWAVADEAIATRLDRLNVGAPNTFSQSVVSRYCADGTLEETVPELRRAYEQRLDRMLAQLSEHMPSAVRWTEPDGGFFVWLELPEGIDAEAMLPDAAEAGVVYMPGSTFFPDEGGERFLRLSFSGASLPDIDRGIAALARTVRASATISCECES